MTIGPAVRAVAAIAVLSIMDALIKGMAAHYPTFQVAFLRFAFGLVVASGLLLCKRPGLPSRETVLANGTRALLAVLTATTFFYALGQLPLAETLLLSFLAPMFVAVFGVVILGERAERRVVLSLVTGFAGTVVVVVGQFEHGADTQSWTGVLAALVSAVCYALALVLLRARAQRDPLVYIVFFQNLGPALILAPLAAWVWRMPAAAHLGVFAVVGALGVAGHVLLTTAFARAEAARLAPLEYTALIWATLIGYGFFGEVPGPATIVGAALIIAGAFMASRR